MISIMNGSDGRRSVVLCDHCLHPILNAEMAVAFVDKLDGRAVHAHKGECFKKIDFGTGFMELSTHLAQLQHNSNVEG